jgi:hypothetical protein
MCVTQRNLKGLIGLALLAFLLYGCGAEKGLINAVQPGFVKKSDLVNSEWLMGQTVVAVPAADGYTFVGDGAWTLQKLKWDVQDDILYARRQTELIEGADDLERSEADGDRYDGEIVAAYRIEQHFDIVRNYNATTGEQGNVLQANLIRPWYEREYMRVDWSRNMAKMMEVGFNTWGQDPVPYFVQDCQEGNDTVDDAADVWISLDCDPSDDACIAKVIDRLKLGGGYEEDCSYSHPDRPVFDRSENGQLEYFDITNKIFASAELEYLPGYGHIPKCWFFDSQFQECGPGEYTIRNSFMKVDPTHQYEPRAYKGAETELFGYFDTVRMTYDDHDGIREQNKKRFINRHNIWVDPYNADGTVKPYNQRLAKPIVYHVNPDWPSAEKDPVLNTTAQAVADDWNRVFSNVVRELQARPPAGGRMFVLCPNNPVVEGDHAECGEAGTRPRMGDIRYSFMAYVPDYMTYGLLGLGPSNTDPETGEIYSGMGYVYHHNDTAAWDTTQMILLLNGDLDPTTFVNGMDLTEWRNSFNANANEIQTGPDGEQRPYMSHGASRYSASLKDAEQMVAKFTDSESNTYWNGRRHAITEEDVDHQNKHGFKSWIQTQLGDFEQRGLIRKKDGVTKARLASLRGSSLESLMVSPLVNDMWAVHLSSGVKTYEEVLDLASPLRNGLRAELDEAFDVFAEQNNMYTRATADDALMGLAREYKNAGLTPEQIYDDVRGRIFTAVLAHEVGHSLGMMHNFGASDDSLNYFDKYWELRTADGTVGPRFADRNGNNADPITQEEVDGKIYNYAYSSVMDYAGRYTIDGTGLGKYDEATMMFGYGDLVQVYNNTGEADVGLLSSWFNDSGEPMQWYTSGPVVTHYTEFYNRMGQDLWDANNRDWVPVSSLNEDFSADSAGRARVPYIYCSHSRYNLGDSCLTRDYGADSYERLSGILDDANTWYITSNFPRGKISSRYFYWNYVPRKLARNYMRVKKWHDVYGLYKELLPKYYEPEILENFYTDQKFGYGAQTMGVHNAFNHLVQTMLMPSIQQFGVNEDFEGNQILGEWTDGSPQFTTTLENGRYYETAWSYGNDNDRECGYNWYECYHHVGFYLDKIMAVEALTNSDTNFVGRATPEDVREWAIGMANSFRPQLMELNRSMMSADWSRVGPYIENGEVRFPDYTGDLTDVHTSLIDPMATFTVQLYWQVLGQARFHRNFDSMFRYQSEIWVKGTGREPTLAPGEVVEFTDPVSRNTYGARRYEGEGAAEQLLDRANRMLDRSDFCEGVACVEPEGNGWNTANVGLELNQLVELIDLVAIISAHMDPSSLPIGDPYSP